MQTQSMGLYLSLCVCHSMPTLLHGPGYTWGNGRGCSLVVHYLADLQSVHGLHYYDNTVLIRNVSECLYSLCAWFSQCICRNNYNSEI